MPLSGNLSGNTKVTYYELNSIFGHDTFLLDKNNVGAAIKVHNIYYYIVFIILCFN